MPFPMWLLLSMLALASSQDYHYQRPQVPFHGETYQQQHQQQPHQSTKFVVKTLGHTYGLEAQRAPAVYEDHQTQVVQIVQQRQVQQPQYQRQQQHSYRAPQQQQQLLTSTYTNPLLVRPNYQAPPPPAPVPAVPAQALNYYLPPQQQVQHQQHLQQQVQQQVQHQQHLQQQVQHQTLQQVQHQSLQQVQHQSLQQVQHQSLQQVQHQALQQVQQQSLQQVQHQQVQQAPQGYYNQPQQTQQPPAQYGPPQQPQQKLFFGNPYPYAPVTLSSGQQILDAGHGSGVAPSEVQTQLIAATGQQAQAPRVGDQVAQSESSSLDGYDYKQTTPGDTRDYQRFVTNCPNGGQCEKQELAPGQVEDGHKRVLQNARAITQPRVEGCFRNPVVYVPAGAVVNDQGQLRPKNRRLYERKEQVISRYPYN
ncbi:hypothetical protein KR009_004595 [Drosophila setifemur]|nr:hypothetical protein KR009_004595 [Drosophila setifemur]